jgi:hypothetical protein
MRPDAELLRRLRGAIAGFAVLAGVSAALTAYAWHRQGEHAQRRGQVDADQAELRRQLATLRDEVIRVEEHGDRYRALREAGTIGEFRKTREVDRFERVARALSDGERASVVRYTLRARTRLPDGQPGTPAMHDVSMRSLSFEASARHEAEFLRVWGGVAAGIAGLSTVESCELKLASVEGERSGSGGQGQAAAPPTSGERMPAAWPRLRASCTVVWYTFEPRAVEAAAPAAPGLSALPAATGGGS